MPGRKCNRCCNVIEDRDCLRCSACKQWYDLSCANVTLKRFMLMDKEKVLIWKCASCLEKQSDAGCSNVTQRLKHRPSPSRYGDAAALTREDFQEFKEMMADQFQKMNDLIMSFQQSLLFFNDYHEDMKKSMEDKANRLQKLEKENSELLITLRDVTKRLNTMEQQSRSNNIEIQCVPEHRSENVVATVLKLGSVVGCKLADSEILSASRVSKIDNQSSRPRAIIVKFGSPRIRDSLLAATIKFNKGNPNDKLNCAHLGIAVNKRQPIYVSEHLSMYNRSLHASARIKAKELKYRFVWIRSGRIFMRKTESSECISITNMDNINSLK